MLNKTLLMGTAFCSALAPCALAQSTLNDGDEIIVTGLRDVAQTEITASRTLVLLNGVEVSNPVTVETDSGLWSGLNNTRIEVARAEQSGLYGSDAQTAWTHQVLAVKKTAHRPILFLLTPHSRSHPTGTCRALLVTACRMLTLILIAILTAL